MSLYGDSRSEGAEKEVSMMLAEGPPAAVPVLETEQEGARSQGICGERGGLSTLEKKRPIVS